MAQKTRRNEAQHAGPMDLPMAAIWNQKAGWLRAPVMESNVLRSLEAVIRGAEANSKYGCLLHYSI